MYRALLIGLGLMTLAARGLADAATSPAAGPSAAATPQLSELDLLANERFWPYYVALTTPWAPPGRAPLIPGLSAVLIRIEASGLARVDFGRDGLYEVPIAATDLLARANAIRSGQAAKATPNFTFAIGPRLVDPQQAPPVALPLATLDDARVFICLFVDPEARGARALLRTLARHSFHPDEVVLLFPQGSVRDTAMSDRLRELDWHVPYLWDHLSEPYAATLLAPGATLPRWLVLSAEGRVIDESAWTRKSVARLERTLAAAREGAREAPTAARDARAR